MLQPQVRKLQSFMSYLYNDQLRSGTSRPEVFTQLRYRPGFLQAAPRNNLALFMLVLDFLQESVDSGHGRGILSILGDFNQQFWVKSRPCPPSVGCRDPPLATHLLRRQRHCRSFERPDTQISSIVGMWRIGRKPLFLPMKHWDLLRTYYSSNPGSKAFKKLRISLIVTLMFYRKCMEMSLICRGFGR